VIRYRQAIAVLALVGSFVALYLWLHALGIGGPLKCGTGGCDTVQTSRWAVFLGLPVAFYGVVGYVLILLTAIAGLRPAALAGPQRKQWSVLLAALASIGFLFTVYLTYLELFVIHAICRWCVASAVIMTAIWVVALGELLRGRRKTAEVGGGV
jgi:uncharacterized membrane protein